MANKGMASGRKGSESASGPRGRAGPGGTCHGVTNPGFAVTCAARSGRLGGHAGKRYQPVAYRSYHASRPCRESTSGRRPPQRLGWRVALCRLGAPAASLLPSARELHLTGSATALTETCSIASVALHGWCYHDQQFVCYTYVLGRPGERGRSRLIHAVSRWVPSMCLPTPCSYSVRSPCNRPRYLLRYVGTLCIPRQQGPADSSGGGLVQSLPKW